MSHRHLLLKEQWQEFSCLLFQNMYQVFLEHGFDQGAMEAIGEYFSEKGVEMEPEPSFIAQYYLIQNTDGSKAEREYQYFADLDAAATAYQQIPNHLNKRKR